MYTKFGQTRAPLLTRPFHSLRAMLIAGSLCLCAMLVAMVAITTHVSMGRILLSERAEHEENVLMQISRQMEAEIEALDSQLWLLNTSELLHELVSLSNTPDNAAQLKALASAVCEDALNNFGQMGYAQRIILIGRNDFIAQISLNEQTFDITPYFPYQEFASDADISPYFISPQGVLHFADFGPLMPYNARVQQIYDQLIGRAVLMHTVRSDKNVILGTVYLVLDKDFIRRAIEPFATDQIFSIYDAQGDAIWVSKSYGSARSDVVRAMTLGKLNMMITSRIPAQNVLQTRRMAFFEIISYMAGCLGYTLLVSAFCAHFLCKPLTQMASSISADPPGQLPLETQFNMRILRNMNMKTTLICFFVLTVTIPTLTFCAILSVKSYYIYKDAVFEHKSETTRHVKSSVDMRLDYLSGLSRYLAHDPAVAQIPPELGEHGLTPTQRAALDQLERKARIRSNHLLAINLYNSSGGSLYSSLYLDNHPITVFTGDFMRKMRNDPSSFVYIGRAKELYPDLPLMFCTGLNVPDGGQGDWGYLTMLYDQRVLSGMLERIKLEKTGYFFMVDGGGELIHHENRDLSERLLEDARMTALLNTSSGIAAVSTGGRHYYALHTVASSSGIHIIGILPRAELFARMLPTILAALVLCGAYLLLSLLIAHQVARYIVSPLAHLRYLMADAEDGMLGSMVYEEKNEIGILVRQYNHMVVRLGELMTENYSVRLHESQLLLAEREAQLKALQQQINPHFLYNTLDAIKWMAHKKGAMEAYEMAIALGNFFRGVISQGKDIITLEDEIEHLKNYIYIQKIRFGDRFDIQWEVEEAALSVNTLKLVLQPLVENAIVHGMENMESDGLIAIRVWLEGSWLVYQVEDNGEGMSEERQKMIAGYLERDEPISRTTPHGSIGLVNVIKRLKLHFGASARMQVQSAPHRGTCVTIRFPWEI